MNVINTENISLEQSLSMGTEMGWKKCLSLFYYRFPTPWTSCMTSSNKIEITTPPCTSFQEETWVLMCRTLLLSKKSCLESLPATEDIWEKCLLL